MAAHYFVSASAAPRAFARSVAEQLTHNLAGFSEALASTLRDRVQIAVEQTVSSITGGSVTGVRIDRLDLGALSDEACFDNALREPLKELYADGFDRPVIIVVDGLDEAATYTGRIDAIRLLARLTDLPAKVRFLLTMRPDPRVLKYYREAPRLDLIGDSPADTDNDVLLYARQRLTGVDEALTSELAAGINEAAEGNFLYASLEVARIGQFGTRGARRAQTSEIMKALTHRHLWSICARVAIMAE